MVLLVQVKPCLPKRLLVKLKCHSLLSLVRISLKCLSVSVHLVCVTCSNKRRKPLHVLFSLMKLMQWVVSVARVLVVVTMNVSRH
ncbi:Uncharacterised protein [Vibrio cholerae]|nr:Uncharacterised protein [Vibrio cholerae]